MPLYFSYAIAQAIEDSGLPLVTEYSLYNLIRPIIKTAEYDGVKVQRVPPRWAHHQMRAMIRTLVKRSLLVADEDFKAGVWRVVQALTAPSAEAAISLVDPFAYLSHMSAMHRYGITDRSPEDLHMTTPARALWNELRDQRVREDLGEGWASLDEPPPLARIGLKSGMVRRRSIALHETRHPAAPVAIASDPGRIAPIGRAFADMLDQPALCGGIQHVLECFDRHAERWLEDIIKAVETFPSTIVKVRAGYILSEEMAIADPRIERWTSCAQRGGSRKLDPHAPYGDRFSEKWMIALNA